MKRTLVALAVIGIAGCAPANLIPTRHYKLTHTFNAADFAWAKQPGTAAITGQAFFQTGGGNPRTCAGLPVVLVPETPYSKERIEDIYGPVTSGYVAWSNAKVQFDRNDAAYPSVLKTATCDAQGNFSFDHLAAGTYYATTRIMWEVGPYGEISGGLLMKRVTLKDGESKRVIMTP